MTLQYQTKTYDHFLPRRLSVDMKKDQAPKLAPKPAIFSNTRGTMFADLIRSVRYPAIDGLRWYAAFLVFLVHACDPIRQLIELLARLEQSTPSWLALRAVEILKDGHHGVDIFFIISGFLMARIIADRGPSFSYAAFIKSRFWRIYPAFLVTYLLCVVYFRWEYGWPFDRYSFFAGLLFLNAVKQLNVLQYNYVTWSLGYEFAFYFVIPFVLMLRRWPRQYVAAATLVAALLFMPDQINRMKGLFVGFLISAWSDDDLKRAAAAIPLWPTLIAYVAIVALKRAGTVPYLIFYHSFIALAGLMLVKVVWGDNFLNRAFRWAPLRMLGGISYSFYLIHAACVSFTLQHVMKVFSVHEMSALMAIATFTLASLSLSLAAAYLCWLLLERPYFVKGVTLRLVRAAHVSRTSSMM